MLDNSSVTSLASSVESSSGRPKGKGYRKPVPKLLPDPPRRISPLSDAVVFRQFAQLPYSEQDHPPLPEDWRENIQKALCHEQHVNRPSGPTPDDDSDIYAPQGFHTPTNHSIRLIQPSENDKHSLRADDDSQALFQATSTHRSQDDRRLSNASSSTSTTSTTSRRNELPGNDRPHVLIPNSTSEHTIQVSTLVSRHPSAVHKHIRPVIKRAPTPPPPGFFHHDLHHKNVNTDTISTKDHSVTAPEGREREPLFQIVYHAPLQFSHSINEPNASNNANRHAAVFPVFPGSATDMSLDATAVDSREDVRSTANTLDMDGDVGSRPELSRFRLYSDGTVLQADSDTVTRTHLSKKWEASISSLHGATGARPAQADEMHHGWWYVFVHKVRQTLCMQPSTVPC